MNIDDKKIGGFILDRNENRQNFIVPDYQRSYVWDDSRVEEFWKDIYENENGQMSFLGSFIFQKDLDSKDYYVVDGQQRMITISIIVSVLRNLAREIGKDKFAISIHEQIARMNPEKEETLGYFLTCWQDVQPFFEKYILSMDDNIFKMEEKVLKKDTTKYNIKNNYIFLYNLIKKDLNIPDNIENIESEEEIKIIVEKIKNVLFDKLSLYQIVFIEVDDDEEAYTAFEIVNARGQVLGSTDLLKNLFYKNAFIDGRKDEMIEIWENISNNIGSDNLEVFLKHFWHSFYGKSKFVTSKKLYKTIRDHISKNEKNSYYSFSEEMLSSSDIYRNFEDLNYYDWLGTGNKNDKRNNQVLKSLTVIKNFKITQPYILFLSLIRNRDKIGEKKIRNIIEIIERFHFMYSAISKLQANKLEKIYARYSEIFDNVCREKDSSKINQTYDKLKNELKEILPGRDEFIAKFKDLKYKNSTKNIIRYIFNEIELSLTTDEKVIDYETAANIEHIYSQNDNQKIEDEFLHSIGNLVILSLSANSSLGNMPVKDKIEKYKESSLEIVKELISYLEEKGGIWEKEDIEKRASSLAEKVYNIIIERFNKL